VPRCDSGAEQELVNAVVFLFTRTYLHRLMVSDDTEFYEEQVSFSFFFPLFLKLSDDSEFHEEQVSVCHLAGFF